MYVCMYIYIYVHTFIHTHKQVGFRSVCSVASVTSSRSQSDMLHSGRVDRRMYIYLSIYLSLSLYISIYIYIYTYIYAYIHMHTCVIRTHLHRVAASSKRQARIKNPMCSFQRVALASLSLSLLLPLSLLLSVSLSLSLLLLV